MKRIEIDNVIYFNEAEVTHESFNDSPIFFLIPLLSFSCSFSAFSLSTLSHLSAFCLISFYLSFSLPPLPTTLSFSLSNQILWYVFFSLSSWSNSAIYVLSAGRNVQTNKSIIITIIIINIQNSLSIQVILTTLRNLALLYFLFFYFNGVLAKSVAAKLQKRLALQIWYSFLHVRTAHFPGTMTGGGQKPSKILAEGMVVCGVDSTLMQMVLQYFSHHRLALFTWARSSVHCSYEARPVNDRLVSAFLSGGPLSV